MQTIDPIHEDKVRQQVRERYGAIARAEARGCGCAPTCCSPAATAITPETLGYKAGDAASVPSGADMGLGCGNPTAVASISPGKQYSISAAAAGSTASSPRSKPDRPDA